jgi:hypothetical protein
MAYIMLRHLVELQLAEVKGIITTLTPSFDRARLVRGTFDILGLRGVPIGVGSDGGDIEGKYSEATFENWARPYMPLRHSPASDTLVPGNMLLHDLYEDAMKKSITLVILASMKDAALFIRDDEELFKEKTKEVVIMGGVEPWGKDDAPVILAPDTANNNTYDMNAARFLYRRVQELGIPLIVITRWAAYAAKVPVTCYNDLAFSGSWIGCRLRNAQRADIEGLWSRAVSPSGSVVRAELPDRCDRAWFLKTFCAGADASSRSASDTIWDLVAGFVQYDTIAALAAIPALRDELFEPCKVVGLDGVQHLVIGRSEDEPNVKNTVDISKFLRTGYYMGLSYNHRRKKEIIVLLQPRWSNHADNMMAFVVMRTLFALGIFDCAGVVLIPVPHPRGNQQMFAARDNVTTFGQDIKKTLYELGLAHVPVLVAGAGGAQGVDHLKSLYDNVTPAGVSLLVTGGLDVAADFAETHPTAFHQMTQNLILVGGAILVPEKDESGKPTGENMLAPDPAAHQYRFDMDAAKRLFVAAQKLLVPLITVSRHFVEAVQLPRAFFDMLRDSRYGGTLGKQVFDKQREGVSQLWAAVRAPVSNVGARRNLPERCDRQWFLDTFCSGASPATDEDEDVWKSMKVLNAYHAQAMLVALPPIFNRFVTSTAVTVRSVKHIIIGNTDEPGLIDTNGLKKLILQCIVTGTRLNSSLFDLQEPPPIPLEEGQRSSSWCYDKRKEALNWLMPNENRPDLTFADAKASEDLWNMLSTIGQKR